MTSTAMPDVLEFKPVIDRLGEALVAKNCRFDTRDLDPDVLVELLALLKTGGAARVVRIIKQLEYQAHYRSDGRISAHALFVPSTRNPSDRNSVTISQLAGFNRLTSSLAAHPADRDRPIGDKEWVMFTGTTEEPFVISCDSPPSATRQLRRLVPHRPHV